MPRLTNSVAVGMLRRCLPLEQIGRLLKNCHAGSSATHRFGLIDFR